MKTSLQFPFPKGFGDRTQQKSQGKKVILRPFLSPWNGSGDLMAPGSIQQQQWSLGGLWTQWRHKPCPVCSDHQVLDPVLACFGCADLPPHPQAPTFSRYTPKTTLENWSLHSISSPRCLWEQGVLWQGVWEGLCLCLVPSLSLSVSPGKIWCLLQSFP